MAVAVMSKLKELFISEIALGYFMVILRNC